jgi:hypothetical protein
VETSHGQSTFSITARAARHFSSSLCDACDWPVGDDEQPTRFRARNFREDPLCEIGPIENHERNWCPHIAELPRYSVSRFGIHTFERAPRNGGAVASS